MILQLIVRWIGGGGGGGCYGWPRSTTEHACSQSRLRAPAGPDSSTIDYDLYTCVCRLLQQCYCTFRGLKCVRQNAINVNAQLQRSGTTTRRSCLPHTHTAKRHLIAARFFLCVSPRLCENNNRISAFRCSAATLVRARSDHISPRAPCFSSSSGRPKTVHKSSNISHAGLRGARDVMVVCPRTSSQSPSPSPSTAICTVAVYMSLTL